MPRGRHRCPFDRREEEATSRLSQRNQKVDGEHKPGAQNQRQRQDCVWDSSLPRGKGDVVAPSAENSDPTCTTAKNHHQVHQHNRSAAPTCTGCIASISAFFQKGATGEIRSPGLRAAATVKRQQISAASEIALAEVKTF